jgi:hypothetical protein
MRNKFYKINVDCDVDVTTAGSDGVETTKTKRTNLPYYIQDVSLEAAMIVFQTEVVPNLKNPDTKSVSRTNTVEFLDTDPEAHLDHFSIKVAYLDENEAGKIKTTFEYVIITAESTAKADEYFKDHLSVRGFVMGDLGNCRIDAIRVVKVEDIIIYEG